MFTYKILQYTCFNSTCYTCSYDKCVWDMSQYNKLSDIQYARFQILPVNLHFGLFWSAGIPTMWCPLWQFHWVCHVEGSPQPTVQRWFATTQNEKWLYHIWIHIWYNHSSIIYGYIYDTTIQLSYVNTYMIPIQLSYMNSYMTQPFSYHSEYIYDTTIQLSYVNTYMTQSFS